MTTATVAALSDTIGAEPIPDMLCQGTITADTLIYSQVLFTGVSGMIRLKDRILESYAVTANVYGGRARGKVAIDLNNLNDPGYSGVFEANDIEADNFITRFAEFGGGVRRLVFENADEVTGGITKAMLTQAVSRYLGHRVTLEDLSVTIVNETIDISINYRIAGTEDSRVLKFQRSGG